SQEKHSGRLNDAYSMQLLIRAKHEKKFPSWSDVAGARDTYPGGAEPYIFGGAFAAFIQQKYGMEKYAQFWLESGKPQFFKLAAGIYKKVYRISLKEEWKNFYQSIPTQKIQEENKNKSLITQGLINTLAAYDNTLVWIDYQKKGVFLKNFESKKIKKLFSTDSTVERLSFSQDGKYLGVSSSRSAKGNFNYKNEFHLFDMHKKSFLKTIKNIGDAAIYSSGDDIFIFGTQTQAQRQNLIQYKYNTKTKKLAYEREETLPLFTTIYSPLILNEDYHAYIQKDREKRAIIIHDKKSSIIRAINLSADNTITPRFLMQNHAVNQQNDELHFYFSWNKENSLSNDVKTEEYFQWLAEASTRAGEVTFKASTNEISVTRQTKQITNGVEKMIALSNGELLFINRSYFTDQIYSLPYNDLGFIPLKNITITSSTKTGQITQNESNADYIRNLEKNASPFTEKKYNPLSYMYKGLFLPGLAVNSMNLSDDILSATNLGLSFFTIDPTEKWQFILYSGYDFEKEAFGTGFNFLNTTHPMQWGLGFNVDNYLNGKTVFTIKQDLLYTIHLRNNFQAIIFKNEAQYKTNMTVHQFYDLASLYFTNYRTVNKAYHAIAGIQTGVQLEQLYSSASNIYQYEPMLFFNFAIPTLMFFPNPENFTLNLPAKVQLQFYPKQFSFKTTVVIFSAEIQKSLSFFPLYFNRFTLNAAYTNSSLYDFSAYKHSIASSAYFTLTPIIGILTTMHFDVGATVKYQINENNLNFSFYGSFRM
ncbi:MAG: hypothetical protein ACRC4W_05930, partial [Treponemataceae bacterium]